jgi:hypothetical protein
MQRTAEMTNNTNRFMRSPPISYSALPARQETHSSTPGTPPAGQAGADGPVTDDGQSVAITQRPGWVIGFAKEVVR